jgi:hypothetical protein
MKLETYLIGGTLAVTVGWTAFALEHLQDQSTIKSYPEAKIHLDVSSSATVGDFTPMNMGHIGFVGQRFDLY